MCVVVLDSKNANRIINHFVAYGFSSFIVFTDKEKIDIDYYRLNNVEVLSVKSFVAESTRDKLLKIRGSLQNRFFIVYSLDITDFSLDDIVLKHLLSQKTVTLIQSGKRLCSALVEEELFDYVCVSTDIEREVFVRVGEDSELAIYN